MIFRLSVLLSLLFSSLLSLESVKIGVLAKRGSNTTLKQFQATADYLSQKIQGYKFEIVPLSFEQLNMSVANSQIDFVLTNTAYYVELEHSYGISRIATLKNLSSNGDALSSFGGVIFTKKDSGITKLKDLMGKRFGAVDKNSFGGWIMAQKELKDKGVSSKDFLQLKFYGSHDKVVEALRNGEIDAGTVRTDTLERMANESNIACENCRILSEKKYKDFPFKISTYLYPEWPFSKLSNTPQKLSNDVLIALLQMSPSSKAAKDAHIVGWSIPLDYSRVHTLLEEMDLSFYAQLKEFTFLELYEKYKHWFYLVSIAFLVVLSIAIYVYRLNKQLKYNKKKIQDLNAGLELKVKDRTTQIENMYIQEKYLKNVLKTIANVNKILVNSYSTQTVLDNTMSTLSKHNDYKFVWVGLVKDNTLETLSHSIDDEDVLSKKSYKLDGNDNTPLIVAAKNALEIDRTIVEKLPNDSVNNAKWMVVLPLRGSELSTPLGVLSVYSQRKNGFEKEEINMLENLSTDIGFSLDAISQKTILQNLELEKISNYEETILAFVNIIEQRDSYTAGHTLRVAEYCRLLATEMGIDETEILKLEKAAILHDIGKVVTPDAILLKPGTLSPLEYELIKQHSESGYQMLSKIEMYKDLAEIIRYHHVRYDGLGYPKTSKEKPYLVSILSHIMVVADAFDAMTSNRIYKPKKTVQEALVEIQKYSGTQFHPDVAKAALNVLKDIKILATSQLPNNEFEQRRFAYFFRDSLTDIYNESYLHVELSKQESDNISLNLVELKQFSSYNHKHGWNKGNEFLRDLSENLAKKYPEAMIFRYHGDDFILIFKEYLELEVEDILACGNFESTEIKINLTHYNLKDETPEI